ncbi:unnamed protein product, partial [Hapterophycus canaliculatus]
TSQAWWPVVARIGAPESDGVVSNYVLVGRAPELDLSLHKSDFSVLWQASHVLGENISGPVPECADSFFAWPRQVAGRNARRQLVLFPYEHPSATATTFDVTFKLPDVALVAHEGREPDPPTATAAASADACRSGQADIGEGGSFEVGKVHSTLLTWRMLSRFSDFRSLNKVVVAEPLVTESPPGKRTGESEGGERKLLSPGQVVPLSFHPHPPVMGPNMSRESGIPTSDAKYAFRPPASDVHPEGKAVSFGGDEQQDGAFTRPMKEATIMSEVPNRLTPSFGSGRDASFRWEKMSWPDGGRTNSLAVSGASVLLSSVGWNRWRAWTAGATATAAAKGGDCSNRTSTSQRTKPPKVVIPPDLDASQNFPVDPSAAAAAVEVAAEGLVTGNHHSSSTPLKPAGGLEEAEAAVSHDADLIADLAAALDIHLSQTSFILEPWQYSGGDGNGDRSGGADEEGWEGGRDRAAVVVRVDMSLAMMSAFFLDGRWAAHLGDGNSTPASASFTAVGNVRRHDDDSPRTTLLSCKFEKIEAFSRPASSRVDDPSDFLPDHRNRRPREAEAERTQTARMHPSANTPQDPEGVVSPPGFLDEAADVTTGCWRTVLEPAAGTVTYAFSPPPSTLQTEKTAPPAATERFTENGFGCRRVSAKGWSALRAVVRPSDVMSVARVLSTTNTADPTGSEVPESGRQTHEDSRPPSSPPSVASSPTNPTVFSDFSLLASGVGITVRLEDDSGTHFVSPPEPRPRHPEEGMLPSVEGSMHRMQEGEELEEPPLPLSPPQVSLAWTPTAGAPWRASTGFARPPVGAVMGAIRSDGEVSSLMGESATDSVSRRLRPARKVPVQQVVEAGIGEFSVKYDRISRDDGDNHGDDPSGLSNRRSTLTSADGGGRAVTACTTATVSISTVRVVDLLQRVPCHAAFRELLVIPAPEQLEEDKQAGGLRLPPVPVQAAQSASLSWRKWMEEEDENDQDIHGSEGSADRGKGTTAPSPSEPPSIQATLPSGDIPVEMGAEHRSQSPVVQVAWEENQPSVLVSYRKVVSFGNGNAASFAVDTGEPIGNGSEDVRPAPAAAAAAAASRAGAVEHCRVWAAVDFGGPISANWNPRTFVALWGVRSALEYSAAGLRDKADRDVDRGAEASDLGDMGGGEASGVDDRHRDVGTPAKAEVEASNPQQMRTPTPPGCSTEIRVAARRGLEMMFNKEKEGRQLMAVSAASLDITVEASSGGEIAADNSAVVWNGEVKDLKARDPRGSNLLYSNLVGPPCVPYAKEGQPLSPVALTFRYSKERGAGTLIPTDTTAKDFASGRSPASEASAPGESGVRGPWESSVLSLSFSELQAVYVQPLWLEVIDFMWEGVLGTAVWGGPAEPETERNTPAPSESLHARAVPDCNTSVTSEAERDGGSRSLSQIHVTMAGPTVILPGSLTDRRHLALRPKAFRFSTWTGGADDTVAPPQLQQCSPTGPTARHISVEAPDCDIDFGLCSGSGPAPSDKWQFHALLQDPVDVKVTVKTESPAPHPNRAESGGCDGSSDPTHEGFTTSDETTRPRVRSSPSIDGAVLHSSTEDIEGAGGDPPARAENEGRGGGEDPEQEKLMQVRIQLPRLLCMSLTPDARAALIGCVGENVLAAGFHGKVSENFPLVAAAPSGEDHAARDVGSGAADEADEIDAEREGRETTREGERAGHDEKMKGVQQRGGVGFSSLPAPSIAAQRQQYPSPPPSSSGTA